MTRLAGKSYPAILLLLLAFVFQAEAKTFRFDYQKTIDAADSVEFYLSNIPGRIDIMGGADNQVIIKAVKFVRASDQEEAEELGAAIDIKVTRTENRISVLTDYLKSARKSPSFWDRLFGADQEGFGGVDYTISVPRNCRLELEGSPGDIMVDGISGELYINASYGEVRLSAIAGNIDIEKNGPGEITFKDINGDISVSASSCDLSLESVDGSADIRLTSGDIRGDGLQGSLVIAQSSGEVNLRRLSGDVRLRSNAGAIDIQQDSGAADIVTQAGDVTIKTALKTYKDISVRTTAGRIVLTVPENSSGLLRLETGAGEIRTDLKLAVRSVTKNRLVGEFGSDGPKISLTTASGHIEVTEY
ncbi:MAG: DUF4097 family beta strand repeat protein [bacterium]|jgi:DUF4097 and DUF4098 domain-containing protein YvlB